MIFTWVSGYIAFAPTVARPLGGCTFLPVAISPDHPLGRGSNIFVGRPSEHMHTRNATVALENRKWDSFCLPMRQFHPFFNTVGCPSKLLQPCRHRAPNFQSSGAFPRFVFLCKCELFSSPSRGSVRLVWYTLGCLCSEGFWKAPACPLATISYPRSSADHGA